jgi:hypothetical protein
MAWNLAEIPQIPCNDRSERFRADDKWHRISRMLACSTNSEWNIPLNWHGMESSIQVERNVHLFALHNIIVFSAVLSHSGLDNRFHSSELDHSKIFWSWILELHESREVGSVAGAIV